MEEGNIIMLWGLDWLGILMWTWITYLFATIFHEAAHSLVLDEFGKDSTITVDFKIFKDITVGKPEDYETLTRKQKLYVYGSGPLAEIITIIGFSILFSPVCLMVFPLRVYHNIHDIRLFQEAYKSG